MPDKTKGQRLSVTLFPCFIRFYCPGLTSYDNLCMTLGWPFFHPGMATLTDLVCPILAKSLDLAGYLLVTFFAIIKVPILWVGILRQARSIHVPCKASLIEQSDKIRHGLQHHRLQGLLKHVCGQQVTIPDVCFR